MFRFEFDDGSEPIVVDLVDDAAARYEAMRSSVELTTDGLSRSALAGTVRTTVFDALGKLVCTVQSTALTSPF
ncbi:hypothetical protein [Mesorhizobium sp. INR15]|uniref:DUF6894 family protein n=1 Tax=Mesorhizobium sp. INR15 TaxID=2654248 RepID=UPI0035BC3DF0